MSQAEQSTTTAGQAPSPAPENPATPQWGSDAPKGARAVFNRIIKEGANVPLFLGQTLINSLRDLGYNDTTSAICEHVDNAIQWKATEVRVYFSQTGKAGAYRNDVLVYDNGVGMAPNVLRAAMAFGGSMCFDNRAGIGRYGVGMKAAALSLGPVLDLYSWQEPGAIYNMVLDVNDISNDNRNVVNLPEPVLAGVLPAEARRVLTTPMAYPRNPEETQELLEADPDRLIDRLGTSGTIAFIPNCDRLSFNKSKTLVDHATREMARVYRRQLERGLRLYINNRRIEPFDPTYRMESARHTRIEGLAERRSRLINSWTIPIPVDEASEVTRPVKVGLFFLPIADWDQQPFKVQKNDLRIFDNKGISFMRSDREVHIGSVYQIVGKVGTRDSWWRLEVEFPAELDEAFGVAVNKQGVRPKGYVNELIKRAIVEDLRKVRKMIEEHWAKKAASAKGAKLSEAERRANEADPLQATVLPQPDPRTADEQRELELSLRLLAVGLKREDETDEQAFERVRGSKFITVFKHDEYWPFYHADFTLGKVILTLNTAHPFFKKLYEPLSLLAQNSASIGGADEEGEAGSDLAAGCTEALVSLQLLLLSLARTQSEMTVNDDNGERQRTFDLLRKQWSMNLATQLTLS